MDNENQKKPTSVSKRVPILLPDNDAALWSNHVVCQNDGKAVYVSFYQLIPPMLIGTDEEKEAALNSVDSIKARPIAKIVLDEKIAEQLTGLIQESLKRPTRSEVNEGA